MPVPLLSVVVLVYSEEKLMDTLVARYLAALALSKLRGVALLSWSSLGWSLSLLG